MARGIDREKRGKEPRQRGRGHTERKGCADERDSKENRVTERERERGRNEDKSREEREQGANERTLTLFLFLSSPSLRSFSSQECSFP